MNYLGLEEVLAIHEKVLAVSGGREGVHDFTLLHSAVERPRASFGGEDLYPTVFNKAAALIHSLIHNHPFNDGNKRTAFVATTRFLFINRFNLNFKEEEAYRFVMEIEKKDFDLTDIASWFKSHSRRLGRNFSLEKGLRKSHN